MKYLGLVRIGHDFVALLGKEYSLRDLQSVMGFLKRVDSGRMLGKADNMMDYGTLTMSKSNKLINSIITSQRLL